jgi:hypothetical protein
MPKTFPAPSAEEMRMASAPHALFTGAPAATAGWPPAVLERLLQINERAETLHRLRVPLEDRQEANTARLMANGNGNGHYCGEAFMYPNGDGKCTDARTRPSGKSWQQEILEKQWKP